MQHQPSPGPEGAAPPQKRGRGRPKSTGVNTPTGMGGAQPGPAGLSLNLLDLESNTSGGSAPPTPNLTDNGNGMFEDPLAIQEMEELGVYSMNDQLPPPKKKEPYAIAGLGIGGNGAQVPPGAKRQLEASPATLFGRAKRPKNSVKFSPTKGKALARRGAGGVKVAGPDGEMILPNNDFCDACQGKGHFLCCDGGCLRSFHFTCLDPPLELDDVPDEDTWFCKSCTAAKNPPPKPPRGFFRELIYKIDCENPKTFQLTPEIKGFYKHVAAGPGGEFIDSTEHRPPSKITGRPVGQEDRDGFKFKDKAGRTILCYNCSEAASVAKGRKIISCDFCEQHWHLECLNPPMTGMPPPTRKWMCPLHADHVVPKKRIPKTSQTIAVNHHHSANNGDIIILPRRDIPGPMDDYEEIVVNRIRYQVPEETVILDFWGRVHDGPSRHKGQRKMLDKLGRAGRSDSANSGESPLTSLGDLSDADPPEVAKLGYSPYSKSRSMPRPTMSLDARYPTATALDGLAALAEGYYEHFLSTHPDSDGESSYAGSRYGGEYSSEKGKGRAVDTFARPQQYGANGVPLRRLGADPNFKKRPRPSLPSSVSVAAKPGQDYAHAAGSNHYSVPPSSAGLHQGRPGAGIGRPPVGTPTRSNTAPVTPVAPTELEVQSKEDLKALMHVRKLMAGTGTSKLNEETKSAMLEFLEGSPIIPKLKFIKPEQYKQPWGLPWEESEAAAHAAEIAADKAAANRRKSASPAPGNNGSTTLVDMPPKPL